MSNPPSNPPPPASSNSSASAEPGHTTTVSEQTTPRRSPRLSARRTSDSSAPPPNTSLPIPSPSSSSSPIAELAHPNTLPTRISNTSAASSNEPIVLIDSDSTNTRISPYSDTDRSAYYYFLAFSTTEFFPAIHPSFEKRFLVDRPFNTPPIANTHWTNLHRTALDCPTSPSPVNPISLVFPAYLPHEHTSRSTHSLTSSFTTFHVLFTLIGHFPKLRSGKLPFRLPTTLSITSSPLPPFPFDPSSSDVHHCLALLPPANWHYPLASFRTPSSFPFRFLSNDIFTYTPYTYYLLGHHYPFHQHPDLIALTTSLILLLTLLWFSSLTLFIQYTIISTLLLLAHSLLAIIFHLWQLFLFFRLLPLFLFLLRL